MVGDSLMENITEIVSFLKDRFLSKFEKFNWIIL